MEDMGAVRVRYAPSPTGPQHVGGIRTALYNYLFARKHNGKMILRIEDTDQTRYVPKSEEYLLEAVEWCGFQFDEGPGIGGEYGPYKQSERKDMYRQYADQLVEAGYAYYAFDTSEELDEMRQKAKQAGMPNWQYNTVTRTSMKNSLSLSEDEVNKRLEAGDPYVIRMMLPRDEEVRINDIIRGWVVVNSSQLDDKVIFKADGMPTYHLANVVDDHLMKITHVIRGEEWLPSAPIHVLLYKYLGWEDTMPKFAHLPLLLKPDGNGKLSKRDGDRLGFPVFPLDWEDPNSGEKSSGYREAGYYPEAFLNILAFLGWNPGTNQEVFSMSELIDAFTLERVGKSGAKFDPDKAKWYNQQYLRSKAGEILAEEIRPMVSNEISDSELARICNMMKERATFVEDIVSEGAFFFNAPSVYDEKTLRKKWKAESPELLKELVGKFQAIDDFNAGNIEATFQGMLQEKELGMGQLLPILRLVVTGKGAGPSMFEICEILGKDEVLDRMNSGIAAVANASA